MANEVTFRRAQDLGVPMQLLGRDTLKLAEYGVEAVVGNLSAARFFESDFKNENGKSLLIDGVFVPSFFQDFGCDEEYLRQEIVGRRILVPLISGTYLPTNFRGSYLVLDEGEDIPEIHRRWNYKRVQYQDEKTVGDLYKNAWRYSYCPNADMYLPLSESGAMQNKLKFILSRDVMVISGDAMDRIADYSKIILFLLSKVILTETEKNIFEPLLPFLPQADGLQDLVNREANIQKLVKYAKENPKKYLDKPYYGGEVRL
jgi:hypothetical protein